MTTPQPFDPSRFLTLVSGKEYLEVKWRLVWLRSEHPEAIIDTDLVSHQGNEAIFKAYIKIPDGGSATGYGSEDAQGFGDYLEKAETKAVGRALAALGYGTQFTHDYDFGGAQGRVVDAPTRMPQRDSGPPPPLPPDDYGAPVGFDRPGPSGDLAATDRQRGLIQALAREQKISGPALDELAKERTGAPFSDLTRQNASNLIEFLRDRQPRRPEAMA